MSRLGDRKIQIAAAIRFRKEIDKEWLLGCSAYS
jgi:hypothetical protein